MQKWHLSYYVHNVSNTSHTLFMFQNVGHSDNTFTWRRARFYFPQVLLVRLLQLQGSGWVHNLWDISLSYEYCSNYTSTRNFVPWGHVYSTVATIATPEICLQFCCLKLYFSMFRQHQRSGTVKIQKHWKCFQESLRKNLFSFTYQLPYQDFTQKWYQSANVTHYYSKYVMRMELMCVPVWPTFSGSWTLQLQFIAWLRHSDTLESVVESIPLSSDNFFKQMRLSCEGKTKQRRH